MTTKRKNRLLLIGALPNKYPNSIGGATMLFKNIVDYFNSKNIDYKLLVSNFFNFRFYAILDILRVYIVGFFKVLRTDVVMVNVSQRGIYWIAPYFLLLGKVLNKKTIIRVFGGNLSETYDAAKGNKKRVLEWAIRNVDVLFVETKALVSYFTPLNDRTQWLPNVRASVSNTIEEKHFAKRFIFLGQIKKSKGIDQLIELSKRLGKDYIVHLYGPIVEDEYVELEKSSIYQGVLQKEEVAGILCEYDVLILPTFWEGEGYPGVIIEGYALGLPCIASRWRAIPEIVDEGETGVLIEPKSVEELEAAVLHFDTENYTAMSRQAAKKFDEFDSEKVNANLVELFYQL